MHPLLKLQLDRKEYSHAYLLEGKNEEKLLQEGKVLAESILSRNGEREDLVRKFKNQNMGDYYELIPKKTFISIDEIRQVKSFFYTAPLEADYRVVFIPKAHKMGLEAANALLKTLEEPKDYGILILTAPSKRMLLPTVTSRCRIFSYMEEGGQVEAREDLNQILDEILSGNLLTIPDNKDKFEELKNEKDDFINYIIGFLGDLFIYQKGIENLTYPGNASYYNKFKNLKNIDKMILKAEEVRRNFRVNANYFLSLDELFIYMTEVAND